MKISKKSTSQPTPRTGRNANQNAKTDKMYNPISQTKYFKLFAENKPNLCAHSSFTDMDGTHPMGNGNRQIITEWGLKDSETPLLKAHSERIEGKMQHMYFLYQD